MRWLVILCLLAFMFPLASWLALAITECVFPEMPPTLETPPEPVRLSQTYRTLLQWIVHDEAMLAKGGLSDTVAETYRESVKANRASAIRIRAKIIREHGRTPEEILPPD